MLRYDRKVRSALSGISAQVDRNLHRSRSQRCHVQYRRNRKSQQSECVPVSLHSTTLYAGLQKWARRYRKAVTVERLYKGTLQQIDWCWKSNTRTPWTTAYLRRRIPRGAVGNTVDYSSFTVVVCSVFWNIDDFITGVKLFSPLFRVSYPIYLQFPSNWL